MTTSIEKSDVGLRRRDVDAVDGLVLFAIVVDTGTRGGYVEGQEDWRTPEQLRDYAARIIAAADWLEAQ